MDLFTKFNPEKAANIITYFILKSCQNKMHYLKIMKLLYLAERKFLKEYNFLMLDDYPMFSKTYGLMNGVKCKEWDNLLTRMNNYIILNEPIYLDKLIYLSEANIKILDNIFEVYGNKDLQELIKAIHIGEKEYIQLSFKEQLKKEKELIDILKRI